MNLELKIAWLYPDLMSTYGDRGNIITLKKRCEWRGIDVQIKEISLDNSSKDLNDCDLVFMGGAQDRQQKLVEKDFLGDKSLVIKKLIEKDVPGLFVCAAYQFVGNYYLPYKQEKLIGAGILDLYTQHPGDQARRLIGNVVAELISSKFEVRSSKKMNIIVGFENHGGRTYLGKGVKPLAKVIKGFGNNGEDGFEGAIYKNVIGSYFHGPILPKNPYLADWLIFKALSVKYHSNIKLEELDDEMEAKAYKFILDKYL